MTINDKKKIVLEKIRADIKNIILQDFDISKINIENLNKIMNDTVFVDNSIMVMLGYIIEASVEV